MMPSDATHSASTSERGVECSYPHRKCDHCHARASEQNQLKLCSKCRAAMYCSRDCQIKDWKKHKLVCIINMAQAEQLAAFDHFSQVMGIGSQNPGGISMVELDQNLEKWIKFHNHPLMFSNIHSLKLPVEGHFSRGRTHLLRLKVSFNENHGGNIGKHFRLDIVEVMARAEARKLDDGWKMILDQVKEMGDDAEAKGRGVTIVTAIECKPLAVQIVPTGSIKEMDMKTTRWVENWEEGLRRCIDTGSPIFVA